MQWKSLDKSTQVWLELNLVSVVTWAWWYSIGKESSSDLFKVAGQWWLIWGGRFTEHVSNMLRCFAIMLICTNWKLMPIAFCLYPRLWVCSSLSMVLYSTLFLRGPLALPWLYEVFVCWKKWTMGPQAALYFQQAKNELYILTALLKLLLAHMSCYCAQIPTIYFCTSREHGWDMIASGWIMLLPIVLVSSSCIKEALLQDAARRDSTLCAYDDPLQGRKVRY